MLLIAATLAVYWQISNQDFINYDDNLYVTENRHVQEGLTREGIIWAFTDTDQAGLWIPLTWLSLMLDHDLYGSKAGGYKITNLLFHLANILLLFMILKKMTGELWRSAFVAALFALHPLRVESVAWVTERKDVLSTLFWMLTLWYYLLYVKRPGTRRYLPIFLALTLGLMAKAMLVTLPFVLLLLDYWPLNRFRQPIRNDEGSPCLPPPKLVKAGSPAVNLVLEKLPLILVVLAVSLGTFFFEHRLGIVRTAENFPVQVRLANGLLSYVGYIEKTICPHSLGVLYPHPGSSLPMWQAVAAGLLLLAISFVVFRVLRRRPYLMVGWLWFLGTLVPVIGLVQVGDQAMADRFTYVPGIGLFIMLAWGGSDLFPGWRHRRIALSLLAAVTISVLGVLSWRQVRFWENGRTLYEHTIRVTGDNLSIQNSLGLTLMGEGKVEEAISHYNEALRIAPDYVQAHNSLGNALIAKGKTDAATAHYQEALRINPDYAEAHNNFGIVLAKQGKTPEALQHFSEAISIKPDYAEAHNNLGQALLELDNPQAALQYFSEAIRLKPDFTEAHSGLGVALEKAKRAKETGKLLPGGGS